MTVRELITELQEMPLEAKVIIAYDSGLGFEAARSVEDVAEGDDSYYEAEAPCVVISTVPYEDENES